MDLWGSVRFEAAAAVVGEETVKKYSPNFASKIKQETRRPPPPRLCFHKKVSTFVRQLLVRDLHAVFLAVKEGRGGVNVYLSAIPLYISSRPPPVHDRTAAP